MKTKDEVVNIQLRISKLSSPELYEVCKKSGPHARAKRIFALASFGLIIENERAEVRNFYKQLDENNK